MCLIIKKEPEQKITPVFLNGVQRKNQDGWGIAWWDKSNNLFVNKGLSYKDFWNVYHRVESRNLPAVIHFRMRTKGDINEDNCHPFKVTDGVYFIHNGTLTGIPHTDNSLSDTWHFANKILKPILEVNGETRSDVSEVIRSEGFKVLMDQFSNHSNKLVLVDKLGEVIFGNVTAHWVKTPDGLLVSNSYAWDKPVVQSAQRYPYGYGDMYGDYYGDDSYAERRGYSGQYGSSFQTQEANKKTEENTTTAQTQTTQINIEIKEGGYYRLRDGSVGFAVPNTGSNKHMYPFNIVVKKENDRTLEISVTSTGKFFVTGAIDKKDVVSEEIFETTNVISISKQTNPEKVSTKGKKPQRLIQTKEEVKHNKDIWPFVSFMVPGVTSQEVGKAITKVLHIYPGISVQRLLNEVLMLVGTGILEKAQTTNNKKTKKDEDEKEINKTYGKKYNAVSDLLSDVITIDETYGVSPEDFVDYLAALHIDDLADVVLNDPAAALYGLETLLLEREGFFEESDFTEKRKG